MKYKYDYERDLCLCPLQDDVHGRQFYRVNLVNVQFPYMFYVLWSYPQLKSKEPVNIEWMTFMMYINISHEDCLNLWMFFVTTSNREGSTVDVYSDQTRVHQITRSGSHCNNTQHEWPMTTLMITCIDNIWIEFSQWHRLHNVDWINAIILDSFIRWLIISIRIIYHNAEKWLNFSRVQFGFHLYFHYILSYRWSPSLLSTLLWVLLNEMMSRQFHLNVTYGL